MGRGRPKKPIALHLAEGNPSHLTKDEIEKREEEEIQVPFKDVVPPDYLTADQKREFNKYAEMLLKLDIFTELDVDILAQYCIAKEMYIMYSKQIKKVLAKENAVHKWSVVESLAVDCEDVESLKKLLEKLIRRQRGDDVAVMMALQDKAHKQCLACARELGMTITSRAKLVIPQPPENEPDEL